MAERMNKVSRRAALAALGTAPAVLAAPAIAQSVRTLSMVTTWPRGLPGLATGAQRFTDAVNAMGAGSIQIEYFAAGEKVGAFDSFDAVRNGEADLYHAVEYYWQGNDKIFNFFGTVPFGFTAEEFAAWIQFGGGQELWDELAADYGLKGFMAGNTGVQMGGWYANPIRSLEDMKGLRIRMPGLASDVVRALGSEPVSMPGGAIPAALFNHEIDAVEWVGPYNDLEFGIPKVLKNYMYPGFHEPGTSVSVGINLNVWNSLDAQQKAIIHTAAASENRHMLAEYSARSGKALEQMKVEYGTQVYRFPDEVYAQVARITTDVIDDLGQENAYARRVVDSFLGFRGTVVPYSNALGGAYVNHRSAFQAASVVAEEAFQDIDD